LRKKALGQLCPGAAPAQGDVFKASAGLAGSLVRKHIDGTANNGRGQQHDWQYGAHDTT